VTGRNLPPAVVGATYSTLRTIASAGEFFFATEYGPSVAAMLSLIAWAYIAAVTYIAFAQSVKCSGTSERPRMRRRQWYFTRLTLVPFFLDIELASFSSSLAFLLCQARCG
jgi:hypothetical protein